MLRRLIAESSRPCQNYVCLACRRQRELHTSTPRRQPEPHGQPGAQPSLITRTQSKVKAQHERDAIDERNSRGPAVEEFSRTARDGDDEGGGRKRKKKGGSAGNRKPRSIAKQMAEQSRRKLDEAAAILTAPGAIGAEGLQVLQQPFSLSAKDRADVAADVVPLPKTLKEALLGLAQHADSASKFVILRKDDAEQNGTNPEDAYEVKVLGGFQVAVRPAPRPEKREKTKSSRGRKETESQEEEEIDPLEFTSSSKEQGVLRPAELDIDPLDLPQPPVPYLEYKLDRVLFNPGVYQLQDPLSRVYNFDPYLEKIMPVAEFDFDSLKEYKTSSKDTVLADLAREHGRKYIGSTSSMTSTLSQFHFLLSSWRPLNLDQLSSKFVKTKSIVDSFTKLTRAPTAIFLRYRGGTYAIDADKQYDSANVLMLLGKSMELLLTLPTSEYEVYRKSDPRRISDAQKAAPEAFQYTTMGDFLMRSQLDAYDPRLPGTGTFDLKTRAVLPVRMSSQDYEPMTGYELESLTGVFASYERERYDMMRATMLKYLLQARMGRMAGIFVAYHNVTRLFGFQFLPIHEMDQALHGQTDPALGDREFRASLKLLNRVLDMATAKFPERSLRLHFHTADTAGPGGLTKLSVFAEPMEEEQIDEIQNSQRDKIEEYERILMGRGDPADSVDEAGEEVTSTESIEMSFGKGEPESSLEFDEAALSQPEAISTPESASSSHEVAADDAASETTLESEEAAQETIDEVAFEEPDLTNTDASAGSALPTESGEDPVNPNLFHATIAVRSKVNGAAPKDGRPTNLKADDDWTIEYSIQEWDATPHVWSLYADLKAQREAIFTRNTESADHADGEGEGKLNADGYLQFLRSLSAEARLRRQRRDELEADRVPVLADAPLPRHREPVQDVDSYLSWLYSNKPHASA